METLSILLIVISPYTAYLIPIVLGIRSVYINGKLYFYKSTILLLAFGAWIAISGIINQNILSALSSIMIFILALLNSYIIEKYTTQSQIESLMKSVVKISLIPVFIGFIEKLSSFFINMSFMSKLFWSASYIPEKEAYRIYSTFGNPNIAGNWFAAMLIISFYFIGKHEKRQKMYYAICSVLFSISIVMTGSRGALVGLGLGLIAYTLIKRDKSSLMLLGLISTASILVLLFSPEASRPILGRTDIWNTCYELIKQSPIIGKGSLGILGKSYEIHAHNIWISITTMLGFGGLIIYLSYRFFVYRSALDLYRKKLTAIIPLFSIQAMIIGHGLVDFPFFVPQGAILFFGTSALIIALSHQEKPHA